MQVCFSPGPFFWLTRERPTEPFWHPNAVRRRFWSILKTSNHNTLQCTQNHINYHQRSHITAQLIIRKVKTHLLGNSCSSGKSLSTGCSSNWCKEAFYQSDIENGLQIFSIKIRERERKQYLILTTFKSCADLFVKMYALIMPTEEKDSLAGSITTMHPANQTCASTKLVDFQIPQHTACHQFIWTLTFLFLWNNEWTTQWHTHSVW